MSRKAGTVFTVDAIQHFFTINDMVAIGSKYWNMALGLAPGDVDADERNRDDEEAWSEYGMVFTDERKSGFIGRYGVLCLFYGGDGFLANTTLMRSSSFLDHYQ
ncbi:MAG: hypothetical protein LBV40_02195 [Methanomicrobiales archaeon]|nr:hypothetical protein [Methanomicrobiales archaeon]